MTTGGPDLNVLKERFWIRVVKTDDCWLWTGMTLTNGYGVLHIGGTRKKPIRKLAHRFSYELENNFIPEGTEIDHRYTCPKNCVNPNHLQAVSRKQNSENYARLQTNNTSGVRGVWLDKRSNKWCAEVWHNYRKYYVGRFDDIREAETAVVAKRNELHTNNIRDREFIS